MITSRKLKSLPDRKKVQNICKAISVLDAILCQEWEYRYYSYNSQWGENEEFFEMRNGEGNQMLVLFREDGCVINGFSQDFYEFRKDYPKDELTKRLPEIFNEFIFGEPVNTIGTTFCIWSTIAEKWETGEIKTNQDGSSDMLYIFDGLPYTYIDWASDYFQDSYKESGIPFDIVTKIYQGETLTKEMVLSIVDELEDWLQLESDLKEINYPYDFS